MLLKCCHPNLPLLYGTCLAAHMIIMSFHVCGQNVSLSVHAAIFVKSNSGMQVPEFSVKQWQTILHGLLSAVHYLHGLQILHNDIKGDNVVIEKQDCGVRAVLVDLGKSCYVHKAKKYSLSNAEKKRYIANHPQIAPDIRDGHCKQSKASDIYSVGRIIDIINKHKLSIPLLHTMSQKCLQYDRPTSSDLYSMLANILN